MSRRRRAGGLGPKKTQSHTRSTSNGQAKESVRPTAPVLGSNKSAVKRVPCAEFSECLSLVAKTIPIREATKISAGEAAFDKEWRSFWLNTYLVGRDRR